MGKPAAADLKLGLATAPVLFACEKVKGFLNPVLNIDFAKNYDLSFSMGLHVLWPAKSKNMILKEKGLIYCIIFWDKLFKGKDILLLSEYGLQVWERTAHRKTLYFNLSIVWIVGQVADEKKVL